MSLVLCVCWWAIVRIVFDGRATSWLTCINSRGIYFMFINSHLYKRDLCYRVFLCSYLCKEFGILLFWVVFVA